MRLAEIWRYPVKSLAGERLEEVELGPAGIFGDRALHVVDGEGELLTARTRHGLLGLRASCEGEEVLVGGEPWRSRAAAAMVREAAGEDARLAPSHDGHRFDDTSLLVATDGAVAWMGADRRRFRPNLLIEGVEGLAERSWPGSSLRVGTASVAVRRICERCVMTTIDPVSLEVDAEVLRRIKAELEGRFALNCEVGAPGRVAVADPVDLVRGDADDAGARARGDAAGKAAHS